MKTKLATAVADKVLPLLSKGQAMPLIDSSFPVEKVADTHARMDGGNHIGKIVLTMKMHA